MCGIAGEYALKPEARVNSEALQLASESMLARGPDGSGCWIEDDHQIGFVHRRLSIIDLSETASQPMIDVSNRYVITFNGEIYNYKELRASCVKQGYQFQTKSDTEVLLAMYQYDSVDMLKKIRGMFAFAIYDKQDNTLFLARDPLGIKPLYYTNDNDHFRFASSLNAMLAASWISSNDIDENGLASFYHMGSVQEPLTYYSAAMQLSAGHYIQLSFADKKIDIQPYWQLSDCYKDLGIDKRLSVKASESLINDAVHDSIRYHMVSDQPVGLFLSAGIDSAVVATMMHRCLSEQTDKSKTKVKAITLGFDEFEGDDDEVELAAILASDYGFDHHIYRLGKQEFLDELPKFFAAMEQPTIDALNVWFVSKAAKKVGCRVVLSGIGGDEAFGGYPSFSRIPLLLKWTKIIRWIPIGLLKKKFNGENLHKLNYLKAYSKNIQSLYELQRSIYLKEELVDKVSNSLANNKNELCKDLTLEALSFSLGDNKSHIAEKISLLETENYLRNQLLRDADWAGMAHSIEIRTPLVDHRLYEQLAQCDANTRFADGKSSLLNLLDSKARKRIESRAKTGFILPMKEWLSGSENAAHWSRFYADKIVHDFLNRS